MVDFVSHALIGWIISIFAKLNKRDTLIVVLFSFLPDIIHSILYFYVGFISERPFFIPHASDWVGLRGNIAAVLFNDIPHSLFFLLLVIVPIVLYFKITKIAIVGYLSHILFDIVSHTGEWASMPFYPFGLAISGLADVWVWPIFSLSLIWIYILLCSILYYCLIESF